MIVQGKQVKDVQVHVNPAEVFSQMSKEISDKLNKLALIHLKDHEDYFFYKLDTQEWVAVTDYRGRGSDSHRVVRKAHPVEIAQQEALHNMELLVKSYL
jgi:hypothetical protein